MTKKIVIDNHYKTIYEPARIERSSYRVKILNGSINKLYSPDDFYHHISKYIVTIGKTQTIRRPALILQHFLIFMCSVSEVILVALLLLGSFGKLTTNEKYANQKSTSFIRAGMIGKQINNM